MNQVPDKLRVLAERLIAYETKARRSSGSRTPPGHSVIEKLRSSLSALMGDVGFSSLLSRALVLAGANVSWLRAVQVKPDGSLEGLDGGEAQVAPDDISKGGIVLVVKLLGLLVAFIGESLTLRLVREVYPKISLHKMNLEKGDKNEKAK